MGWDQVAVILATLVLAVLTGTMHTSRRIDDLHRRIDDLRGDMNTHLKQLREDMNTRLGELREDMNRRFAEVDAHLGELRSLLQERSRTG